jgi:hypothetical protein
LPSPHPQWPAHRRLRAWLASQAVTIPNKPVSVQQSAKPMVMLVSGARKRCCSQYTQQGNRNQ